MRLAVLFALSSVLGNSNCKTQSNAAAIPSCIQVKIESLQEAPVQNPPAIVTRYLYNGQNVYLFNAPCCDQFSSLYDESCMLICYADGGITGKGDGKCADFVAVATEKILLWQDHRIRK